MSPAGGANSAAGAPTITLARLGQLGTLAGTTLEASVVLDPAAGSVTKYEIELVAKDGAAPPDWSRPLWSVSGGPLPAPELGRPSHGPPPAAREQAHWFETLDGCPAERHMVVGSQRPTVRLGARKKVKAYDWRLWQFGRIMAEGRGETDGISPDGECIRFRLPRVFRRGALPKGFFYPPFRADTGKYRGETYPRGTPANPAGHSAFSVDFNQGSGSDDLGLPVLAAAPGRVVTAGDGIVDIVHYDGDLMTHYGHMRRLKVKPGDEVKALQKIGEIGGTGGVSPHLHHRHLKKGANGRFVPIKMRFGMEPVKASVAEPREGRSVANWKSDKAVTQHGFSGWLDDREAKIAVAVHWKQGGERTAFKPLKFFVAASAANAPSCIDVDCVGGGEAPGTVSLEHVYNGPVLEPGKYQLRYRVTDDLGTASEWAYDKTLRITG